MQVGAQGLTIKTPTQISKKKKKNSGKAGTDHNPVMIPLSPPPVHPQVTHDTCKRIVSFLFFFFSVKSDFNLYEIPAKDRENCRTTLPSTKDCICNLADSLWP